MKRTALRARPKPKGNDPVLSRAWWEAVTRGKTCAIPDCHAKGKQGHHVLAQQHIRKAFPKGTPDGRSLQQLLWDIRNGIALCERHHMQHEAGTFRIPAAALPWQAFCFANELGLGYRLSPTIYPR